MPTGGTRRLKRRVLSAYPLYGVPQPWPLSAKELAGATDLSRLRDNVLTLPWGDTQDRFAAIHTTTNGDWVSLRLARLSEDILEVFDLKKLAEDLLSPGDGRYFSTSAHLLIDCASGLAVGEYKPEAVRILGTRPSVLINHALHKSGIPQTVDLKPFPSRKFRDVVLGKVIESYDVEFGQLSAKELESLGLTGSEVRGIIEDEGVLGVKVRIRLDGTQRTRGEKITRLEKLGVAWGQLRGVHFKVRTEDFGDFDLLRNNLERFGVNIEFDPKAPPRAEREACLNGLRRALDANRETLLSRIPPEAHYRERKLDDFKPESDD